MSLPNVPSLSRLINKGGEGGKEFARIMNLLLVKESGYNRHRSITHDDASGDHKGVDLIVESSYNVIGFQFKFFEGDPGKLKSEIKSSLKRALDKFPEMNEWILVSPDDFTRHGMHWIDELNNEFNIDINHWGHTRIIEMMTKYPSIGKAYYPKLFPRIGSIGDRVPLPEEIENHFQQFIEPDADFKGLYLYSQPNLNDIQKIFDESIATELCDLFYMEYRTLLEIPIKHVELPKDLTFEVFRSTTEEIEAGKHKLPNGMRKVQEEHSCFLPSTTFYSVRFKKSGEPFGSLFSVWCFVNGRWVFLPKPWRVVRTLYGLRSDPDMNSLMKIFKTLRVTKMLKDQNPNEIRMVVNHISHRLINEIKK